MSRRLLSSSPRQYESASRFWGQLQDLAASASDPLAIMRASPSATKYTRCWRGVHGHSGDATILRPSSQRLLASFLSFANENRIPVVPQSGNTSLVGSAVPSSPHELLLSMDRYPSSMSLDSAEHVMTLDAGVKLQDAIDYADSKGFVFPIDLGAKGSCMVGGNVATNAGGIYFNRFGSIRSNLLGLEVVLPSGEVLDMTRCVLPKDSVGFDLKSLFIGSEGTLGVISKVCMKVHTKPTTCDVAVLSCPDFSSLMKLKERVEVGLGGLVSALEIMDRRVLELVRERTSTSVPWELGSPYYVLVETMGFDPENDGRLLESFFEDCFSSGIATDGIVAQDSKQRSQIWGARESCGPAVNSANRSWKYDLSAPLSHWASLTDSVQNKIGDKGSCVIWGHLGDRNIHLNIVSDLDEDLGELIEPDIYHETMAVSGSISAEHGVGIAKAKYLKDAVGDIALGKMEGIKRLFDPAGVMNPGKLFNNSI